MVPLGKIILLTQILLPPCCSPPLGLANQVITLKPDQSSWKASCSLSPLFKDVFLPPFNPSNQGNLLFGLGPSYFSILIWTTLPLPSPNTLESLFFFLFLYIPGFFSSRSLHLLCLFLERIFPWMFTFINSSHPSNLNSSVTSLQQFFLTSLVLQVILLYILSQQYR